ncbi:MAG: EAL domain-containing protein [Spirulina sp. SIO3F2]|nr:EAL domain-containing protein [Spirulina sp. SIO3F2]
MTAHQPIGDELHTQIQYRLMEELAASEARYRQLVENLNEIVFEIDHQGHLTFLNRVWTNTLGYELNTVLTRPLHDFLHPEEQDNGKCLIRQILDTKISIKEEFRFLHQSGHLVWLEVSARPNGKGGASGVLMDISDRKRATAQLQYLAYHDTLTGLPNRLAFVEHLEQAIANLQCNPHQHFAVLFLDLDGFKLVNDTLGHLAGDRLLIEVAQRLQKCLSPQDVLSRFGGDEFNILLRTVTTTLAATQLAKQIHDALTQSFELEENKVFISTSIGIVLSHQTAPVSEHLLQNADIALYNAKAIGKANSAIFDCDMHTKVVERLQLEHDLRHGLERDEFEIYYQPIFGVSTPIGNPTIKGFEALLRWHHPTRGLLSPERFIPIAEETGFIVELGFWVLHQACSQAQKWQEQCPPKTSIQLNVNLSSRQFLQPDLLRKIDEILQGTGLERQCLTLEITESTIMNDTEATRFRIKQLKSSGISLSIDDFGTGYSSLSYLHRFPINTLKIDRSFVQNLNRKSENTEIIEAIIVLAHKLGMDVVAEGVENPIQLKQLNALGCQQFQGYFFSRPLTASQVKKVLAEHQALTKAPRQLGYAYSTKNQS